MTPNTEENRKSLEYGAGYLVEYLNVNTNSTLAAIAIWGGQDFNYPTMLRRIPPMLEHVKSWSCVKEWRPEDG